MTTGPIQCMPLGETQSSSDSDEDLPPTKPSMSVVLWSVTAYVETRHDGVDWSRGAKYMLNKLGAQVVESFTRHVTHVVFKDGKRSTYQKAVSKNIHLVSVKWIDMCKTHLTKVPEGLYPPVNIEHYKFPSEFTKIKRLKPYQSSYKEKSERVKQKRKKPQLQPPQQDKRTAPVKLKELTQYSSPAVTSQLTCDDLYVNQLFTIAGYIDPKYSEYVNRPESPKLSDEDSEPTPLAVRLLRRFIQSPQNTNKISPKIVNQVWHFEGPRTEDEALKSNAENIVGAITPTIDGVTPMLAATVPVSPLTTDFNTPVSGYRRRSLRLRLFSVKNGNKESFPGTSAGTI